MMIAPAILQHYPGLNDAQRAIIGHLDGPLLVIAGPGSGKTYSIVLRALNLLLLEEAQPRQLVLCTFTEKAAFEMRDRLAAAARKVGYAVDLSELTASTIHSFCNRVLTQHRHRTALGHSYDTLDDLTQLLFIFEHFDQIIGPPENDLFLLRWKTRWTAIEGVRGYFDKITEELVDVERIARSGDPFLSAIGHAYLRYEQALLDANRTDFAHLQRFVYDLLSDPGTGDAVTRDLRYVLVDEYQDTNYIQEQLLLKLTERNHNLCVVGDEDQSLYRFRGATVRNILEFQQRMPGCATVTLTTNYRSHRAIVERYDRWMASADWSNGRGAPFRYDKTIEADAAVSHPDYPSVIAIWGRDRRDEAARFADLVEFLKRNEVIADYGQVPVKKTYSFTGDLKIYETCPRQYQFFREYDFTPSRSAVIFFGLLVHQTIEEIHRIALDGRLDALSESGIRQLFDRTFRFLCLSDVRPIDDAAREEAFEQVMNYFGQNQDEMRRVIQTEVDVSLEKDGYILVGKVDLLLGGDGKLELLDFKTSPRPKDSPELIAAYERQLCTYAHILENRHNRSVDRLMLYWTSEPRKADAMMVLPYDPKQAMAAGRHFDETVWRIQASDFAVTIPPEASICKECDLRMLCTTEGVFAKQETPV